MLDTNKKETIYYSGFSMDPPETLELLINFEGRITSDQNQKIIKLEEYKILSFWDKIEQIGVWNWSKKYPVKEPELEQLLDGYRWELKLRDRNGKAKYCSGYMSFPRKFKDLIKELNALFGSNIKF
jgi:starvation-inducible outer membrane lipoprotein|tara:strand:+ start:188 stop:565 length:378 start_codon:yes stop_codon:yes gene_type:complete